MLYTLSCIVIGEDTTFSVKVDETKLVHELKKEIMNKRPNLIASYIHNATHLTLYKAKINASDEANYTKEMKEMCQDAIKLREAKLNPWFELSIYFKEEEDRPEKTIHVLVQLPSSE